MITEFQGKYRWLSNFWEFEKPLIHENLQYPTNEHFYVAMKTNDVDLRKYISTHPLRGLKKFGSSIELCDDWHEKRLDVMLFGLRYKFSKSNLDLRTKLVETKNIHIQEGNRWGDKFWGVCLKSNEGENHLGRLIMQVRFEILLDIN